MNVLGAGMNGLGTTIGLIGPDEVTNMKRDPCDAAKATSGSPNEMDLV